MGQKWTPEEDEILKNGLMMHGKQWNLIAKSLPNRTISQIAARWEKCLDPKINKGPFTPEEDEVIRQYVKIHGARAWPNMSQFLPNRSPKQCRERWCNHLAPDVNKNPWTQYEDNVIFEQHELIGGKWSTIAKHLNGRTDNAIKNRWNSSISKRVIINSEGKKTLLLESSSRQYKKIPKITTREKMAPPPPLQLPAISKPILLKAGDPNLHTSSLELSLADDKKDEPPTPFSPGMPITPILFTPSTGIESGFFSPTSPLHNFSLTPISASGNSGFLFSPTKSTPESNDQPFK